MRWAFVGAAIATLLVLIGACAEKADVEPRTRLREWLERHRPSPPPGLPAPPVQSVPVAEPLPDLSPIVPPILPPIVAEPPPPAPSPPLVKPQPRPEPKARPPKPKHDKPRTEDGGPDLPWSCDMVRSYACGKSAAQLRQEGAAQGVQLTPKQRAQAAACLHSCPRR